MQELADLEQEATVFTELRTYTRVGQHKAIVDIGSTAQPFKLFLPDTDSEIGQQILRILDDRYLPKDPDHVRRSYAYVHGPLKLVHDEPEVIVTSADQITRRTGITGQQPRALPAPVLVDRAGGVPVDTAGPPSPRPAQSGRG